MELVFDERSAYLSLVEMIWHTHSERASAFTSAAVSNWEMVITTFDGKTTITARGPETKASEADFPADAEFFGIIFKLGTFMPHLPLKTLLDRQDATLPEASSKSFWLHGSAWELPTFENADVFVDRLIHQGILVRDPVVEAAIQEHTPDMSIRLPAVPLLAGNRIDPQDDSADRTRPQRGLAARARYGHFRHCLRARLFRSGTSEQFA